MPDLDERPFRFDAAIRGASLVALGVGLILIAATAPVQRGLGALEALVQQAGPWGPLLFGAAYVVGALALLPGSVLTLAAGALFGPVRGVVVVSAASTTAATLAFLIARHGAREAVERAARRRPVFRAIGRAVGEGGWKVVALLRLSPLVPFSIANYLFGLTGVRLVPYALASAVAMLPGTVLYVGLGHAGRAGLATVSGAGSGRTAWEWALLAVGLGATAAVTAVIARRARAALQTRTEDVMTSEGAPGPEGRRRPWALASTAAAILATGVLSACGVFGGLLGPPRATLREEFAAAPGRGTFDHGLLDALLVAHVDSAGLVDYRGLQRDAGTLDRYLAQVASADLDALARDERLALLINAYNACTLRLILDHLPLESIRDIPADQRWDGRAWTLGGQAWTLSQLENEQVRTQFREPRVHFALNCASLGCPPLRREAYVGARLEDQLEDQARTVHGPGRWFRYDAQARVAHLTRLYDWYGDDFAQVAGSPLEFVARYSPELRADLDQARTPDVTWPDYDWRLNAQPGTR